MLQPLNRLRGEKLFLIIMRTGKSSRSNKFTIYIKEQEKIKSSRIGIVISKKISKKAVVRNKLKRRIGELFKKDILPNLKSNYYIVIRALPGSEETSYKEIREDIILLVKKLKLI